MRCIACDELLTDVELLIKSDDGSFEDLCHRCLSVSNIYKEELADPLKKATNDPQK